MKITVGELKKRLDDFQDDAICVVHDNEYEDDTDISWVRVHTVVDLGNGTYSEITEGDTIKVVCIK